MRLSTIPFLLAGLVAFVGWLALRAEHHKAIRRCDRLRIWAVLVILVAWAAASALLASTGVYLSEDSLRLLPGLWLPAVPFVIVGLALGVSRNLRQALVGVLDVTPPIWLVYVHALRIAALGTLVKTIQGTFPLHFELGVGIPDLVFGLSALWMARAIRLGAVGWRGLAAWHLVGFAVVALPASLLLQMGLPGPLLVFEEPPTSEALLAYPMALAPTIVVPLFLMLNLWAAIWLLIRRTESEPGFRGTGRGPARDASPGRSTVRFRPRTANPPSKRSSFDPLAGSEMASDGGGRICQP